MIFSIENEASVVFYQMIIVGAKIWIKGTIKILKMKESILVNLCFDLGRNEGTASVLTSEGTQATKLVTL